MTNWIGTPGKDSVAIAGPRPWVDVQTHASLNAAVTAIGGDVSTLLIPDISTVASNVTIPNNVTLLFVSTGQLSINSGVTVTINGPVWAGARRIFSGAGVVRFVGADQSVVNQSIVTNGRQWDAFPQWWGASGDDATDNAAAFQAAHSSLQNSGIVLVVPQGVYRTSGEIPTLLLSIVGQIDPRPVFKPTAAAVRTFRIGSATLADFTDKTRLENIEIDLANAPNNHVAIEGTRGVSQKQFRRIKGTNSAPPSGRAASAAKNHTGLKLVFAAGDFSSYLALEDFDFTYLFTGINLDTIANGVSSFAGPRVVEYRATYVYRPLVLTGVGSILDALHISQPTDMDTSLGDFSVKMVSQGGVIRNLWLDPASGTMTPNTVLVNNRTQVVGGNLRPTDIREVDTSGNPVAVIDNRHTTLLSEVGIFASDVNVRDLKPNFIVNPDFRWWFFGTSFTNPATDTAINEGWLAQRSGTASYTIDREATIVKYAAQSLKLAVTVAGAGVTGIHQFMGNLGYRNNAYVSFGQGMSLAAIARGATGGEQFSMNISGATPKVVTLTTTFAVYVMSGINPASDMDVVLGLAANTTGTVYIDNVMLYPGEYYDVNIRPTVLNDEWESTKTQFVKIGGKYHYYGTAAPAAGTWAVGDRVWATNPSEAGGAGSKYIVQGWTCTSAGTPGTWLEMRMLTGN